MSSIGPTLPPHLVKRKRTPDDDASPDSPPTKIRAQINNKEEIDLESDSDGEYGPSIPKPVAPPSIGPSMPPAVANTDEVALDSEDDESIGPAAPPRTTNTAKRSIGPTLPPTTSRDSEDKDNVRPAPPEPKRIHGPAPPPASLSERPSTNLDSESESDSDDDYGPALPSSTSHQQRQARALAEAAALAANPAAPKRDDWMLAPPSAGGGYRDADPSKLKARKFNSGPRASASESGEISSIWTETPEEKRKRLENAVLGRDTSTGSGAKSASRSKNTNSKTMTKEEAEQVARVQKFTEATRGRSLYEEHQAAKRASGDQGPHTASGTSTKKSWVDEEEDDPSKRAFDKEKDMKLGGRIGASQRKELLNKAADFGGRFSKGKYL